MNPLDYRQRVKYQRIVQLSMAGTLDTVSGNQNTDINYKYVTGILVSTTVTARLANAVLSGSGLQINGEEVFPANFELKRIATHDDADVPPNEMFYELVDGDKNRLLYPAKNSRFDVSVTDGANAGAYKINFWLRLENIDEKMYEDGNRFMRMLKKLFQEHKD